MGKLRNNVVVAVDCVDQDEALHVCGAVAAKHEIGGSCRNFTSVSLEKGQAAMSLRSANPMVTAVEIMSMLQSVDVETFDVAVRQKLSDNWTVMRFGRRRRIRLVSSEKGLNLQIKKTVIPRTRLLSL